MGRWVDQIDNYSGARDWPRSTSGKRFKAMADLRQRIATRHLIGPALMVRCAQCQLHLPQDQALRAVDRWYCCDAHRAAGQTWGLEVIRLFRRPRILRIL